MAYTFNLDNAEVIKYIEQVNAIKLTDSITQHTLVAIEETKSNDLKDILNTNSLKHVSVLP
jgi:hypothetical protein